MQKRIVVGLILLILATALFIIGCSKREDIQIVYNQTEFPKGLHSCVSSADCIVVQEKGCCACPDAINKKFVDYWNSLENTGCPNPAPLCQPCLSPNLMKAVCENKECKAVAK
ncbi:hypothetical protein FJZ17_02890 [Candidatus Pacearchaeota archaeon]|nr:hypothetical protein [Candidatus Pacearchaeota archaeon]